MGWSKEDQRVMPVAFRRMSLPESSREEEETPLEEVLEDQTVEPSPWERTRLPVGRRRREQERSREEGVDKTRTERSK
ncbi:hypothetical protein CRG98_015721 [Punica granatum]|uniref:Uncharacterized protein n=1 Tax=Punica granatum TaxID=22663 RepID=A0A2I0K5R5_PUNGR|nr:hypothetical protein CRG98_015721 [Punica granatum]